MKHVTRLGRRTVILLLLSTLLTTPGCYTYHVYQIGGEGGREQGNQPSTEWENRTLHGLFWGLIRQDLPVDNCQLGSGERLGIEELKIETNYGYLFLSVLSLGIWNPVEVSWRCAKPKVPTGTLE